MQVVFTQDVKNVAHRGEVKNVKDGYFQNFLQPNRLAVLATAAKIREAEQLKKNELVQREKIKEEAGTIQKKLEGLKVTIKGKARGDKLYGSITEKELIDAIEQKSQVRLARENIMLSEHIKVLGSYEVPVKLVEGVEATVTLEVKSEK